MSINICYTKYVMYTIVRHTAVNIYRNTCEYTR